MARNVSQQILQILADTGVTNIYGVTGDALNFLVKAIEEHEQVQWRACKHEGNAAFAAFGESEVTGELAVCAGTVGPGALHLVNGLYNAKKARTPVLAITGQVPQHQQGTNFFQEVDLKKVFDDICAYQAIIQNPEDAPKVVLRAVQIALAQRTVCRIELAADIAEMTAQNDAFIHPVFRSDATLIPGDASVQRAVEAINAAERIGILAGHGCREARAAVLELSNKIKAPITHTLKSLDVFDHDTENVVGLTGLIGNPTGYHAVMDCDLLLMLGTDFPYTGFLPHGTRTIQVDIRAENIGNRTGVDIGIHGDIQATLDKLLPLVETKNDGSFLERLNTGFQQWRRDKKAEASPERDHEPLHPQIFLDLINEHAAPDAIFTIETGTAAIWTSNHLSCHSDRRLLGSFNHGSMAVGLPAALGVQFAFPDREVWALCGDGAFNMTLPEFITAVHYELPIKVLVLNNAELSFVKIEMEEAGLAPALDALHQENVNFAEYAKLCGGTGRRVTHAADIEAAVLAAKQSSTPFVIDAVVNSGELALPPHIGVEEAVGFGTSKLKEIGQIITGDKQQWENLKKEITGYFD